MLIKLWCWLFGHKNYFCSLDERYFGHPQNCHYEYMVPMGQCIRCGFSKMQKIESSPLTEEEVEFIRKENGSKN